MRNRPPHTGRTTRSELIQFGADLSFTWSKLHDPVVHEWSEDLVLALDGTVPWMMGPAERDPLRGRLGTRVLPRAAQSRLAEIDGLGVPFQRTAFGHELDPVGPVAPFLPALRTGRQACAPEVARTLVGDIPAHPSIARLLAMLDWAARGPWAPTKARPKMTHPPSAHVIFGVIAPTWPRDGQLCLWFPLTAWRW